MPDDLALYGEIGFLFSTDDGSLPEVRLAGLTGDQTPVVYAWLRGLATKIHPGAYFWDRRSHRETPVHTVPNAAAFVQSGDAEAFHLVLEDPQVGAVAVPQLGVFVFPDEIALNYRMGPEWGPTEVAAMLELLCQLQRLAPGSRVELEEHVVSDVRDRFAATVAQYCNQRHAV